MNYDMPLICDKLFAKILARQLFHPWFVGYTDRCLY